MNRVPATMLIVLVAIVVAAAIAVASGTARWKRQTDDALAELRLAGDSQRAHGAQGALGGAGAGGTAPRRFDEAELESLPAPVARYFRTVLTPGQPLIHRALIRHDGDFARTPNAWQPFRSRQLLSTAPRGFIWDATIRFVPLLPLLSFRVRDSYVHGKGSMVGTVAGVVRVVDQRDAPGMAEASLLRYLAEATWFPTALLPSEGVQWTAVDDATARASLTDGTHTVSAEVYFGAGGEIARMSAKRGRYVNGTMVLTPWEGHFSDTLRTVDGMRIPVSADVSWLLPKGRHTYWRGLVVDATYEYR